MFLVLFYISGHIIQLQPAIFLPENFADMKKSYTFASELRKAPRGGAVVARWAHNPKAGGSIPSPATQRRTKVLLFLFCNFRRNCLAFL